MKCVTKYSGWSVIARGAVIAAVGVLAASCADDTLDSPKSTERTIRFEVSTNSDWNSGELSTRGGVQQRTPGVLPLSGGDTPLYLVPNVRDGISKGDAAKATRGSLVTTDDIESFGVFASMSGSSGAPDYMCNEEVTSANGWQTTHEYLWPGDGALRINAYSPYLDQTGDEGITSLPSASDEGELQLGYVVPAKVSDQLDLMWSTPVEASASPCNISFNHALTAIRFAAGAELVPCVVKDITIRGLKDSGTLNLATGVWTNLAGSATYSIAPDLTLTAADGGKYVEAGTPIADGDNTFILMPQDLSEDASISLTLLVDGKETVLDAPLSGQNWTAGKTITYRISANPNPESLVLEVTGDFASTYTGGTNTYSVKSSFTNGDGTVPVKWIAEFVDDAGNVIDCPEWITSLTLSGNGDTDCSATTTMQDIVFDRMSAQTRILQNAADINQTSGNTPYNLASSSGSSAVENTANTYVINAPGKYSLPLVYGNAIKNGSANTQAYTATTHNRYALKGFVNHLGNAVSDPYIYNNSGCTPADAVLLWEDELNLVRNVSLSSDGRSVEFDVPHNTIRQGNALVAVRDAQGAVMWSWQIWVTDYVAGSSTIPIAYSGKTYELYPRSVGDVIGGDVTTFAPTSVKVRFTQTDTPAGVEPLRKTVEFVRSGITISTPDCFTYYQWGRKDPMMPGVKQWYDAEHKEITSLTLSDIASVPSGESVEQYWILHPAAFLESAHNYVFSYTNLWNTNLSTTAYVKTIYDPSPVGSMVPSAELLRNTFHTASVTLQSTSTDTQRAGFYVTLDDGTELYFPAFGYRSGVSGVSTDHGVYGEYWTAESLTSRTESRGLVFSGYGGTSTVSVLQEPRGHGFGVRPMLEN